MFAGNTENGRQASGKKTLKRVACGEQAAQYAVAVVVRGTRSWSWSWYVVAVR